MGEDIGGFVVVGAVSAGLVVLTSLLMYEALRMAWRFMVRSERRHGRILYALAAPFLIHVVNIWLYGLAYLLLYRFVPEVGKLVSHTATGAFNNESLLASVYFSAATYTSLGFGDITPIGHIQMIAGAEALNGLLLIGWSVTFSFLAMEEFWDGPPRRKK